MGALDSHEEQGPRIHGVFDVSVAITSFPASQMMQLATIFYLLLSPKLMRDRYIIDHYDNLPDAMLFIHSQRFQWHNDDPYYDGVGMLRNFQLPYLQKQGYVNLRCVWTLGCPGEIHPLSDTHRDDVHAGEYFTNGFKELFPGVPIPEQVGASCCAQFAVSRDRVRERPRSDYVRFRDWLINTDLTDDLSGRIMEYSWHSKYHSVPATLCVIRY